MQVKCGMGFVSKSRALLLSVPCLKKLTVDNSAVHALGEGGGGLIRLPILPSLCCPVLCALC